ncbi:hypothetical protein YC2023_022917 [Brassica napus]
MDRSALKVVRTGDASAMAGGATRQIVAVSAEGSRSLWVLRAFIFQFSGSLV